ncbi:MAG: HAD family hydrolase [Alphaproteobacteria bacterium]|nr:HAD family hydrolase [Alphaproteobacteria bacterium]
MARRRAVLFDVGGPIDLETALEREADRAIREAFGVDGETYAAACRVAVESFAPDAYRAIVWQLAAGDPARAAPAWEALRGALAADPPPLEPRPGIAALLADLDRRGVALGLVANQPAGALDRLRAAGLADAFRHFAVSGTTGLRKPDPRAFLAACAALDVPPAGCVMVGDRIDNDIAPARALGMAAIRLRGGRHAGQRPRTWLEVPDRDVDDVAGLAAALDDLLG